ncbi:MAG: protein kinase [Chloroflexi bacterium]|nr:protein kinase [Chloroflexota bacterium]MBP8059113.1 protein kinase [Chloroflexota bacterium]
MSLNQGQELNQRYRVVSLIGQGGFGAVYRAWDLTLKRPCAVKENLDTSAEAQKQFDREVQLLSNLHHSNLPRIYDYFFLPGMGQYLVMDFIEGQNLQTMLETRGPLPEAEVVPWMRQICDALAYMHSQNPPVIHRDIKPANIIITPQGRAVLVDFGISKIYDTHLKTTVGARAVTPGFSPWEQYGQGTTDTRSDIYALGATLYVLLTGQEPPESIALMGGMATLTPPRQINRAITPHVAQVIEHAMQTRPTERFAAAAALGQALLQYTPAVSTSLTPSSLTPSQPSPYALLGWVLGVGGIGILLLVTVLVIGISLGRNQNNRTGTLVEASTIITPSTNTELTNEPTYQSTTLPVTTIVPTITSLSLPTATTTRRLTQTPSLTPTIALGIGSIQLADKDGMIQVYIPDGEFIMGTNNGLESEMPVHAVYLDDYWIDQTEVTNSMYAQCVAVNYCQPPAINSSYLNLAQISDSSITCEKRGKGRDKRSS